MKRKQGADKEAPQSPGFPCQTCGARIEMSVGDLIRQESFRCRECGVTYYKDAGASAKALDMLKDVDAANRRVESLKRRYR